MNKIGNNVPITDPLEIVIFDTVVRLEFLVLPRNDILLGIDWLNMTEALVCSYNKSIIFKKRQVFLEPDRNIEMDENEEEATDILSSELEPIDIEFAEESDQDYWPLKSTKLEFLPVETLDKQTNIKLLTI